MFIWIDNLFNPKDKPEIIIKLQKETGKRLRKLDKFLYNKVGYVQDMQGKVIGLSLCMCQLSTFPSSITKLQSFTILYLSYNELSSVPDSITKLQNLTELHLNTNQLNIFPSSITKLQNLTKLYLGGNPLGSIPNSITKLQNLRELDLSANKLSSVPDSIAKLQNLRELDLSYNQLTEFPSIAKLQNLRELNLSYNQLTEFPSITKLQNLTRLGLWNNQFTEFPKSLLGLNLEVKWDNYLVEDGIHVKGNPFQTPPVEIVKQGRQAIINYYNALEAEAKPQETIITPTPKSVPKPQPKSTSTPPPAPKPVQHPQYLNEAKLLLIGDGGAGKTSLLKRLLKQDFNPQEAQTHGINIDTLQQTHNDQTIKLHCWDFGGQQIMHATHQFFLSKRSLYLLVLDSRRETDPHYWLQHIQTFGKNAPVIIVINKIDENPHFDLSARRLKQSFPNLKHICKISCATQQGLDTLHSAIQASLPDIELLNTRFPASWLNIKNALMQQAATKNFTSYDHYLDLCHAQGIHDDSSQHTLINFLHDLGVIIHFPDGWLRETNVINPQWLVEAVYTIITAPQLAGNAKLQRQQLNDLLDPTLYPSRKHHYLLELMRKFQLCYPLNDNEYLFPDLFPASEPAFEFDDSHALRLYCDYDFLPKAIFTRLVVKLHRDIQPNTYWRNGILLQDPHTHSTALIETLSTRKRITFHVNGKQAHTYLTVLRFMLDDINRSYQVTVTTPVNDLTASTPNSETEVMAMLEKILSLLQAQDAAVDEKSFLQHVDEVLEVRPGLFGVSVDVKELVKKIFGRKVENS